MLNETKNLVQFLHACKVTSLTDKSNKNETKKDFLHENILWVFFNKFQLLLKLKSDEKLISKIIFVEYGI